MLVHCAIICAFPQDTLTDAQQTEVDNFVSRNLADKTRQLVDLLKLTLCGRAPFRVGDGMNPREGCDVLTSALLTLATSNMTVREMLLEMCVTEMEYVCVDFRANYCFPQPVVQESPHPYKVRTVAFLALFTTSTFLVSKIFHC